MKKNEIVKMLKVVGGFYLAYNVIYGGYSGIKVAKTNKRLMNIASAFDDDNVVKINDTNVIPILSGNDISVLGGCCGLTYRPPLTDTVFIILDESVPEDIRMVISSHEIGHIVNGDFNRSNRELNKINRERYKKPEVSNPATWMEIKADEYAVIENGKEAVLNMMQYLRTRLDVYYSHPMRIRYRKIALADLDFRIKYIEEHY